MSDVVLQMQGICKRFGATRALNDVHLTVRSHEIHALMGENGAGKSTLMKVLSGVYQPDAGTLHVDGKPVVISCTTDARRVGINLIYQELSVATNLTVAQNVFLGSELRTRYGTADTAAAPAARDAAARRVRRQRAASGPRAEPRPRRVS